ncbi:unnamed protein product, partial [Owenia fusiformis]
MAHGGRELIINVEEQDQIIEGLVGQFGDKQLPEGKEYHIFFSHASIDLKWVRQIVKILESPPYNLTCCYDDRDFMPGRTSIFEINRCIITSMKTVLIFTPEAVQSRWCQTEVDTAITASYDNLIDIVPIKLRQCELPDTLKHISYLDITNMELNQGIERIIPAITRGDDQPELPPQVQRNMATSGSYFNIPTKPSGLLSSSCMLDISPNMLKEGLDTRRIPLQDNEVETLTKDINSSGLMRKAWVIRSNFPCLPERGSVCCTVGYGTFTFLSIIPIVVLSTLFILFPPSGLNATGVFIIVLSEL